MVGGADKEEAWRAADEARWVGLLPGEIRTETLSSALRGTRPLPLREVLSRLSVEVGWSYAVFWRVIVIGDTMLLNWGDGHHEPIVEEPDMSEYRNPAEGNVVEHARWRQDEVNTVVNSFILFQAHVMGTGGVRRAAATSTYQWIFQCDLYDCCLFSKVFTELSEQFSANMQISAIILIPLDGVLQFWTVRMVFEDIALVNYIRGLFTKAGSVHAAISSVMSSCCLNEKAPIYEFPAIPSDQCGHVKCNQFPYQHGGSSALKSISKVYFDTDFLLTNQNNSSLRMPFLGISVQENTPFSHIIQLECWASVNQLRIQIGNWQNMSSDIVSAKKGNNAGEAGKLIRKRLRPGKNPRSRPIDRQHIRDRLNELREIVPHGAKCTIDALLEKTIEHMLFLQSAINHSEKLKKSREQRITEGERGLLLKDNFVGGATWAFKVISKFLIGPIIVEDVSSPCQMLVEMLWEEQGHFLDVADSIRGLGLTILKGVMEVQNTTVWARFAVEEANRGVTRMEIVLYIMLLLEPSGSSNMAQGGGIMNAS